MILLLGDPVCVKARQFAIAASVLSFSKNLTPHPAVRFRWEIIKRGRGRERGARERGRKRYQPRKRGNPFRVGSQETVSRKNVGQAGTVEMSGSTTARKEVSEWLKVRCYYADISDSCSCAACSAYTWYTSSSAHNNTPPGTDMTMVKCTGTSGTSTRAHSRGSQFTSYPSTELLLYRDTRSNSYISLCEY